MKIEVPTINDLKIINEIAVQVHECHKGNWNKFKYVYKNVSKNLT